MSQISKPSISGSTPSVVAVTHPTSYPYQILPTDFYVIANSSAGPETILLPANPVMGNRYSVVDGSGNSGTNPITIQGNGHTIDSQADYVISNNYGFVGFLFDGNEWKVINQ